MNADHDPLCPMQQCEHVGVWCEHECHCDSIAAVRAQIAADIEELAGPNPCGGYPAGLRDAARIARTGRWVVA